MIRTDPDRWNVVVQIYGSDDPGDHLGTTRHARVCADLHSPHVNRRSASFHNVSVIQNLVPRL
jgi:hypothetical protein